MQKRMKAIALLLIAALATTACGQAASEEKKGSAAGEIENFNAEGYPICDERVTIKIFGRTSGSEFDLNQNPAWQYMEELFNVNFEFEVYSANADAIQNGTLMMSDPTNPNNADIFWNCGFDISDWLTWAEAGHILRLDDYIDQYGTNIKKAWESNPMFETWAKAPDGNIYGLPIYLDQWYMNPGSLYINDRWLENVGMSHPTTLEELKEVLIAFRDKDANGNGDPTDEIPMKGNTLHGWFTSIFMDTAGLPGGYPYTGVMYYEPQDQPGTYLFQPTTDEYRYVVEFMHSLYAEGLLEQDMFAVTSDIQDNRMLQDKYGVARDGIKSTAVESHDPEEWSHIKQMRSAVDPDGDYIAIEPPYYDFMGAINAYTKYPEVCVRILDFMMSADGSALFLGKNSETIDFAAAGVSEEVIKIIDDAQALKDAGDTRALRTIIGGNFGPNWFAQFNDYMISDGTKTNPDITKFNNIMEFKNEDKVIFNTSNKMLFTSDENEIVGNYKADIHEYVRQKLVEWVSGDEELTDATWAAYKKQLQQMGLDELNKVYQDAFSRWSGQN